MLRLPLAAFAASLLITTGAFAARTIDFAASPAGADALILAVADEKDLSALSAAAGADAASAVASAIARAKFKAKEGETASFVSGAGEVHLVGVKKDGMRARDWADFGGRAAALALKSKAARVALIGAGDPASAALGAALGQYQFLKYKSEKEDQTGALVIVAAGAAAAKAAFDAGPLHVAEAALWVRDMQSEPANVLYPEEFVRRTREAAKGVAGLSFEVLDVSAMEKLGMGAILGVGRGSVRPPRMLIVRYRGAGAEPPIAFAGKGITFDSGGISIKPNDGMWQMKSDMTGAAVSVATVIALAKSKAPLNAVGVAALAENMPDGGAIRPGDVLRSMSGKTIEIMSTDAEGRLVLADAVWYLQVKDRPRLLIDVATLTGSVRRALSDEYAGLFTRDDATAAMLLKAGDKTGEELWRLPLHPNHFKQVKSVIADVKNGDTGDPGASTGAAFIASFVKEEQPWAHLDIASVDWLTEGTPTMPKGASGFGVRLLYEVAVSGSF
jgi:leucyl aminopeptidase